jgi:membrane protease YdiL (CAAX protease family)
MDATGLSQFSALPLFPLLTLFWFMQRLPRLSVGFSWGRGRHYALAVLYPVIVLGVVAMVAALAGVVDISAADWSRTARRLAIIAASTLLVAIITEEGFFRGWLWASLSRAGLTPNRVLVFSSIAFALWHLSAVTLDTGFDLPAAQIPVFMVNAAVIGIIWGLLRSISGSVVVSSVSHGIWNAGAYELFGFGTKIGALGVKQTSLFGPEVGVLGLATNAAFAAALWFWVQRSARRPA